MRRNIVPGSLFAPMWVLLAGLVLVGCATVKPVSGLPAGGESRAMAGTEGQAPLDQAPLDTDMEAAPAGSETPAISEITATEAGETASDSDSNKGNVVTGTGVMLGAAPAVPPKQPVRGDITLNFDDADLREVVKVVLGDILGYSYSIDPRVQGRVNLMTSKPLTTDAVPDVLDTVLRMNGAALVESNGLYRVVPLEGALRGTSMGHPDSQFKRGLQVRIVPLTYVAAAEMTKILEPILPAGALINVDTLRNLLILAGTPGEIANALETISLFDVNWLQGMSVGLFPLKSISVKSVSPEIDKLVGEKGPFSGLLRVVPIDSLNALLVVTPKPQVLEEVRRWINQIDGGSEVGRSLHVYRVRNGRAADIAKMLGEVFGGETRSTTQSAASLAPGSKSGEIFTNGAAGTSKQGQAGTTTASVSLGGAERTVRIVADEANNALIIHATPGEFETIEAALRELDVEPLQVLVDATIVEVTLTDELRYGLQWTFRDAINSGSKTGLAALTQGTSLTSIAPNLPGFSYSIVDSAGAVLQTLDMLAKDSKVRVLSSPSLMVLNNQAATIQVGDQVPVRTSESTNTTGDNPIVTSTIQYRDTGVTLKVQPRVNPGGLVIMDVEQQVDDVSSTQSSNIDSPTIQQRKIQSSVAVQSGETIVLGGLIREVGDNTSSGIPVLHKIPVFGALFGQKSSGLRRTELLVLLTPRVAHTQNDAKRLTEEFRRKLGALEEMKP